MQKKCIKKRQLVKKSAYQKAKKMQKEARKTAKKEQNSSSKKNAKTMQKKCTCTTKFHTPLFLCEFFFFFSMFVRFMCDWVAFVCIFCAFVVLFFAMFFCVFSRKRTNNAKNIAKKTQIQSKNNAKAKTRTFLIAFVLLFDCICFCIVCAFLLHLLCFFCICFALVLRFLHLFSGQMRWCFFFVFCCIPRHPLVTYFLRFLCIFFGIGFALCLHCLCILYVLLWHQN